MLVDYTQKPIKVKLFYEDKIFLFLGHNTYQDQDQYQDQNQDQNQESYEEDEMEDDIFAIEEEWEALEEQGSKVENEKKEVNVPIYIDSFDTIYVVKQKIETYCGIPAHYQCIYFEGTDEPIGHKYTKKKVFIKNIGKENIGLGTFINEHHMLLGKVDNIIVRNLSEYIYDQKLTTDINFEEYYDNYILPYWPFVTLTEFKDLFKGQMLQPKQYEIKDSLRELRTITTKEIKNYAKKIKKFNFNNPMLVKMRVNAIFNTRFNLPYLFDKLRVSKNIWQIIGKFDETRVYKKYFTKIKMSDNPDIIPADPGIYINDKDAVINMDGTVRYDVDTFLGPLKSIYPDIKLLYREEERMYMFKVSLSAPIDYLLFEKLALRYREIVDRDYKNYSSKNFMSFYFKKVSIHTDQVDELRQQAGSFIKIIGTNILEVQIHNIHTDNDISSVFNFFVRLFYLYEIEYAIKNIKKVDQDYKSKNNLKNIDPKLFNAPTVLPGKQKLYSRICQRPKQPIAFFKDLDIFDNFVSTHKIPKHSILYYKNFTYPGKTTAYVCSNKKYPYVSFLNPINHPENLCMPCCGKIDKRNTPMYKKCATGDPQIEKGLRGEDITNLYYIRKYTAKKSLPPNKLSYLPDLLHDMLNDHCLIKQNSIAVGSKCYLLVGSQNDLSFRDTVTGILPLQGLRGISEEEIVQEYQLRTRTLIILLEEKNGKINTIDFFDRISINNFLIGLKNIIIILKSVSEIVKYNIVTQIELPQKKNYIFTYIHDNHSYIIEQLKCIYNKIITEESHGFINITDIYNKKIKATQVLYIKSNIVSNVIIDEVYFPITPSLPNGSLPIIRKKEEYHNEREAVLRLLKKLSKYGDKFSNIKITGLLMNKQDENIGFELGTKYIFFKPQKEVLDEHKIFPRKKIYYDMGREIPLDTKIDVDYEIYNVLFMHLAHYLNEAEKEPFKNLSAKEWETKLLEKYGSRSDNRFINDYILIRQKKHHMIEYLKETKNSIIEAKGDLSTVRSLIRNLLNKHIIINERPKIIGKSNIRNICNKKIADYTLVKQCSDDKLLISQEHFDKFTELLTYEIIYNPMKRYQLLENKISAVVNLYSFSKQPNTEIVRII